MGYPLGRDDIVLSEAAALRSHGHVHVDTSRVSAAAVQGRRHELTRAIRNLLDNAERHASSGVALELVSDDHRVTLVVHDDGPGIPPGDRQRIFERFTRLDDARSRQRGGTGLGLAITKEIVEAHGGTIAVGDASRGARFVVHLPPGLRARPRALVVLGGGARPAQLDRLDTVAPGHLDGEDPAVVSTLSPGRATRPRQPMTKPASV